MGKESKWKKTNNPKFSVDKRERDYARKLALRLVNKKIRKGQKIGSFKISRKALINAHPEQKDIFQHSFLIKATPSSTPTKIKLELGAIARGASYTTQGGEEVTEGILGHSKKCVLKTVQYYDDEDSQPIKMSAVKIGAAATTSEKRDDQAQEKALMQEMGYFEDEFEVERENPTEWIEDGSKIRNKRYLVQKHFRGMNLLKFLKKEEKRLSLNSEELKELKIELAYRMAVALNRVHEKGFIHNDIKPQNFMIDPDTREVSLIDFELSVKLNADEDEIKLRDIRGAIIPDTKDCLAPEVACYSIDQGKLKFHSEFSDKIYSKKSDIYSLGFVVFDKFLELSPDNRFSSLIQKMKSRSPSIRPSAKKVAETLFSLLPYSLQKQFLTQNKYHDLKQEIRIVSTTDEIRNPSVFIEDEEEHAKALQMLTELNESRLHLSMELDTFLSHFKMTDRMTASAPTLVTPCSSDGPQSPPHSSDNLILSDNEDDGKQNFIQSPSLNSNTSDENKISSAVLQEKRDTLKEEIQKSAEFLDIAHPLLQQYEKEKKTQSNKSLFLKKARLDPETQFNAAVHLDTLLTKFKFEKSRLVDFKSNPTSKIKETVKETVNAIVEQLVENQKRHRNAWCMASSLNLITLQSLPEELQVEVCRELEIDDKPASEMLKALTYAHRRQLAHRLNAYIDRKEASQGVNSPKVF